ncbi:hypothetical protein LDL08_09620 [Nonomuraea glycinis]|uniref:Uncharacterized protein n=1 Tax=Nonomuraea glycinis TaxID=2047744 RepID=A0A918A4T7_9ACTN|nr:hypothetical protein [Nonomuraea glycinis]MCA2176440.1 hypothetical protein [Nonomuraea glycinis]GGP07163.1 hypothetical protein GCM10012278_33840 [Nonomuraea glycinis]
MTWLRDVLVDLADDSPQVDLAERTIATHDRRRRTVMSQLAAAMIVVIALGVTAAVRLLPDGPQEAAAQGDLPARGVEPLSHAYKIFCKPKKGKAQAPSGCRDGRWRVVTRSGKAYYVTEALPSLSPGRSGLRDSPLAISRDGRKIAYYSAKERTFQVRDLASGEKTTAADKVPEGWLGSVSRLMLSDDGRFVAFSKVPDFKDPALLIDMRARVVRELPNRWVPIGLSQDGATITLAQYSPNSQLRTITNLWPSSSAGNSTSIILPKRYDFSPLAPDGKTVAVIENRSTAEKPCRHGDLALMDTLTGKKRKATAISGLPPDVSQISLRTWLSGDEVTALTTSVRCRPSSEVPDDEPAVVDPPYQAMTAYALNVRTGKARKLATYKAQDFFGIVLPGPPGAL